jgi:hypothetical protein
MEKIKNFKHNADDVYLSVIYDTTKQCECDTVKQVTSILSAIGWTYRDEVSSTPTPTINTIREKLRMPPQNTSLTVKPTKTPEQVGSDILSIIRQKRAEAARAASLQTLETTTQPAVPNLSLDQLRILVKDVKL